jgi:hypothetical protein
MHPPDEGTCAEFAVADLNCDCDVKIAMPIGNYDLNADILQ